MRSTSSLDSGGSHQAAFSARNAARIDWGRCDLPNERNFMKYWMGSLMPSMKALNLTEGEFAKVTSPVLTIHGTKDRSAPYGGGREWALLCPNARLVNRRRRRTRAVDRVAANRLQRD